jgi:hypothetical protein
MGRAIRPGILLLALLAGAGCAPGTLGSSSSDAGTIGPHPIHPSLPPPPQPLTSCGDGKTNATGSTDDGLYIATAIRVSGRVCSGDARVTVDVAGNLAPTWDFSFQLQADRLDGNGLHVPLGQQVVSTTYRGQRARVTVDITASDDAYLGPDGGAGARLVGSFEEYDGNRTIKGDFDCPYCGGIWACIDLP